MTMNQIGCFMAVVKEKNYTRAANSLYISQPAVSKSISMLEEELGFKLLRTVNRQPELTDAGKLYYDFLRKVTDEYGVLMEDIRHIIEKPLGEVRIGCPDTWNPAYFYNQITDYFEKKHPEIRIVFEGYRLSELITRLQTGKLDIVLTHNFFSPSGSNIVSKKFSTTGCGILCSQEVFAGIKSPADFAKYDFLIYDEHIDKRFGSILNEVCESYGFSPKIKYTGSISTSLFNIARSEGIMLFSDWDSAISNTAYKYYPVDYKIPTNILYREDGVSKEAKLIVKEIVNLF